MSSADEYHRSVMLTEVLEGLDLKPGGVYVDATLGGGGHALAISNAIGPDGLIVGIDRDGQALLEASSKLSSGSARFVLAKAPFDELPSVLAELSIYHIDGAVYDLGVSSRQLDDPSRGFSFKDSQALLDMRMGQDEQIETAADLLNSLPLEELTRVFLDNAEERWGYRIAQFVVARRQEEPFRTVAQLVETVKAAIPAAARSKDTHAATKVFQALRIAVNDEFGKIRNSLKSAIEALTPTGRIVVITFHSLEDRIVKQLFSEMAGKCICPPNVPQCVCMASKPSLRLIVRKPILPTAVEVGENPRARSAKLRIAAKL